MIRTLLWKEYREQRTTAVALAVFAVALLVCVQVFGEPSASEQFPPYASLAVCLVWMTGLIAGSQAFAVEAENGTLNWLDALPSPRRPIGRTKVAFALLLTLVQALLLLALGIGTHWIDERHTAATVIAMFGFGLAGLSGGLCASAFATSALNAFGLALVFQSLLIVLILTSMWSFGTIAGSSFLQLQMILAIVFCVAVPFVIALHRFTRLDRQRRRVEIRPARGQSWRALLWLVWRQSRVVFWMLLSAGLLAVIVLPNGRTPPLWPALGLVFGIIAGVGTFAADLPGGAYRFLGDRRVPLGRVWLVKVGLGLAAALAPALLQVLGMVAYLKINELDSSNSSSRQELVDKLWAALSPTYLLLTLLYGFAIAQFLGLIGRKSAVAFFLAVIIGAFVLIAWWPSLIVGGVHWWQWILPPILLLVATRWLMRPWSAGRLGEWRIVAGIGATAVVAVALTLGGVAYRVIEPPERAEPFDVAAFERSLPTPEQNAASIKLGLLFKRFHETLGQLPATVADDGTAILPWPSRAGQAVQYQSWPADDAELNRQLDAFAAEPWINELRAATSLPLGMANFLPASPGQSDYRLVSAAVTLGNLLDARALQLAQRGQVTEAFDAFFLALDLSRNVRSKATGNVYINGAAIERSALQLVVPLAEASANQPNVLADALKRLEAHDRAVPPMVDTLKIDYLAARDRFTGMLSEPPNLEMQLTRLAASMPWELARTRGILNSLCAGYLRTAALSYPEAIRRIDGGPNALDARDYLLTVWTPPPGTTNIVTTFRNLDELVRHSPIWTSGFYELQVFAMEIANRTTRRAALLQWALGLDELRHGKPAAALAGLVPEFLSELPLDPFSEAPFDYRISAGEDINWNPSIPEPEKALREIPAGQGVLWSVGGDGRNDGGHVNGGLYWNVGQADRGWDPIFLVPLIEKR
jgi:ABC-type transport system involved in cytochrome c biogenesis permease component